MKEYLLLILFLLPVAGALIEDYVNDYAGVLTQGEKAELQVILSDVKDKGKAELAVVIINSLDGRDIEGLAYEMAEGNLGDESDNGILILLAIEDRQYRIEVGRGLEPVLTDSLSGRIGREYLQPNFQQERYGEGLVQAATALSDVLEGKEAIQSQLDQKVIVLIIIILIVFIILSTLASRKKNDNDYFIAAWVLGNMMRKGPKGGFGGSFGGGFGGGSFGGGGASGRW